MGIYDRDYVRNRPPGPGAAAGPLAAVRMFSANTWIIIICAAIFLIDGFGGTRPVEMGTYWFDQPQDEEIIVESRPRVTLQDDRGNPIRGETSLVVQTNQGLIPVGKRTYQWMRPIETWLHFSTTRGFLQLQFWRFIGFQFLHAGFGHLLFNMIGLFFFGPLVERHLGSKRYLAFYLLCGIFGAIMYLVLNLGGLVASMFVTGSVAVPGLLFNSPYTELVGASAGVFGVLMAGAFLAPNAMVLLFFFIPMRLRTLAYGLVILALFVVITGGQNAGGEAGHLGGALAGFYFIRNPRHLHGFFDILGRVDPSSHHYRDRPGRACKPSADQVDRILDKVNAEGVQSLTAKEKKVLAQASRRDR